MRTSVIVFAMLVVGASTIREIKDRNTEKKIDVMKKMAGMEYYGDYFWDDDNIDDYEEVPFDLLPCKTKCNIAYSIDYFTSELEAEINAEYLKNCLRMCDIMN